MTFPRLNFCLLSLLTVLALSGCIGRQNAVKSQESLRAATTNASTFAGSLEKAMEADYQAHVQTRATLDKVLDEWTERHIAAARLPIFEARAQALLNIHSNLVQALQDWQAARREANNALADQLSSILATWETAAKDAQQAANAAADKADEFPNDLELALTATNLYLKYVSIVALYNTTELKARTNFTAQWDAEEASLTATLLTAAETQRQNVEKAYNSAIEEIKKVQVPEFDLGPDPTNNAVLIGELAKYLETVEVVSEAMLDYLESNSLGKGSFFHSALKSFSKGFFGALPFIGTGKGATLEEVKSSGGDLLKIVQNQFTATALTASTTAQTTMKQALDDALKSAKGSLANALSSVGAPPPPH